ncbi:UNVERIFIED_CONTAM: hypothetical protein K2H54_062774 [Gekko kuhli]
MGETGVFSSRTPGWSKFPFRLSRPEKGVAVALRIRAPFQRLRLLFPSPARHRLSGWAEGGEERPAEELLLLLLLLLVVVVEEKGAGGFRAAWQKQLNGQATSCARAPRPSPPQGRSSRARDDERLRQPQTAPVRNPPRAWESSPGMAAAPAEAESSQPLAPAPAPPPPPQPEKKKLQRAPSPARPKDVPGWSLARSRRGSHPGSPASFSGKPGAGLGHSRRLGAPKDGRCERKGKAGQSAGARGSGKGAGGRAGARTKGRSRLAAAGEGAACGASGRPPVPPGLSLTDSSSEVSDCSASEEAKLLSLLELGGLSGSDTESPPSSSAPAQPHSASADGVSPLPDDPSTAASIASSRLPLSTSLAFSDLTEELLDAGVARELEELRSENDYLKNQRKKIFHSHI